MNLHHIWCEAWTVLHRNYSDDSEGHSSGQLVVGSFSMATYPLMHHISCSFFCETSNCPGESAPLQPRFGALRLLAFPKTKVTFEREEISDCWWDSWKYDRTADGDWENCVRSQGAYFERDWVIIVLCSMFLVSTSINVSIFHITWLDTFWTDHIHDYPDVLFSPLQSKVCFSRNLSLLSQLSNQLPWGLQCLLLSL